MQDLNGYSAADLQNQVFSQLSGSTRSTILARVAEFEAQLRAYPVSSQPVPVSLGENCGPGVKIRETQCNPLGAFFFDNIVAPIPSIIQLFQKDFQGLLQLQNLRIGQWERNDSVFDESYDIFFHHYFHLRPMRLEKSHIDGEKRRRRIDEADIPLFLPIVSAQFAYLTAKLRLLLRSEIPKLLCLRRVQGRPVDHDLLLLLEKVLRDWGARNFEFVVIHSDASLSKASALPNHHFIPETATRWGQQEVWRQLFDTAGLL